MSRATRFTALALTFEAGLGLLAGVAGWLSGHSPWETLQRGSPSEWLEACLWGVAATIPLVLGLLCVDRWPVGPLARMKQFVEQQLVPLFKDLSVSQLGMVALAAGVGEELLFRGWLQAAVAQWTEGWIAALIVASVVFGVCHWVTALYAILATIVGFYLGGLFIATEHLAAPIVTHALYDFLALVYLVNKKRWPALQPTTGRNPIFRGTEV